MHVLIAGNALVGTVQVELGPDKVKKHEDGLKNTVRPVRNLVDDISESNGRLRTIKKRMNKF